MEKKTSRLGFRDSADKNRRYQFVGQNKRQHQLTAAGRAAQLGKADMLSPSPLKPSAPSASLLRFLRSQSDYFTANPSTCLRSTTCSKGRPSGALSLRRISNWTGLDPAPCRATVEANLFAIPNLSTKKNTPPRGRCALGKEKPVQLSLSPLNPFPSRTASTKSRPLLRRLFDLRRSKESDAKSKASRTGPALIDDGTESNFNIGRGLVSKATNELRLRCTEFDINGNVTLVNGEFRKSELIAKVCLPGIFGLFQPIPRYSNPLTRMSSNSTVYFPEIFAKSIPQPCRTSLFGRALSLLTSCIFEF